MLDEHLRQSCFLWLEVLRARFGDDIPSATGSTRGFHRALRAAHELRAPIVYFIATRPGWYRALYPVYVEHDSPAAGRVLVAVGRMELRLLDAAHIAADATLEGIASVRTGSVSAPSITVRSIKISSVCRPTMRCTSLAFCSTSRMDPCSIC